MRDYPKLVCPPPGPKARAIIERGRPRERAGGGGRGRQSLPRLRGRHRGGLDRPLPSRRRGRGAAPGRAPAPPVRDRLLQRGRRHPRRRPGPPRARPRPLARLLRELRGRGRGGRDQAGAPAHGTPQGGRLLRRLPRPDLRRPQPHGQQARPASRLHAAAAGGAALALRVLLPVPGQPPPRHLQGGVPGPPHGDDVLDHDRPQRDRGRDRRARAGRGRIRRAASRRCSPASTSASSPT